MARLARLIGTGDCTPARVVSNEEIAQAIPGWSAETIREKTGLLARRFLFALDPELGRTTRPPAGELRSGVDLGDRALRHALAVADVDADSLDALFVVTGTPDRPDFNWDAMELHRRLGMRVDATALVFNDGCGGTPYALDLVHKLLSSGAMKRVAIVATHLASALVDRRIYGGEVVVDGGRRLAGFLSTYVFGDGAGAAILTADESGLGIVSSLSGNAHDPLVLRRGGGAELPYLLDGASPAEFAFVVDGHSVATSFPAHMRSCLGGLAQREPDGLARVERFYLHQPNKRVLDRFAQAAGLAPERVASTVERYGNTSAAGMLVALSEDVREGRVRLGSGQPICIAAAGANVHYGAQLIHA